MLIYMCIFYIVSFIYFDRRGRGRRRSFTTDFLTKEIEKKEERARAKEREREKARLLSTLNFIFEVVFYRWI